MPSYEFPQHDEGQIIETGGSIGYAFVYGAIMIGISGAVTLRTDGTYPLLNTVIMDIANKSNGIRL